jgi:hypothetical protein
MKFYIRFIFISGFLWMNVLSCTKEQLPSDLLIKLRYECGWCSFHDLLKITSDSLVYTAYLGRCDDLHPDTIIYDFLSDAERTSLMNKLNLKKYMKCIYDHCGTCYDGCDFVLDLHAAGQSNLIRYVSLEDDSTMQWMVPFVNQLHDIRKKYAPAPW